MSQNCLFKNSLFKLQGGIYRQIFTQIFFKDFCKFLLSSFISLMSISQSGFSVVVYPAHKKNIIIESEAL